MRAKLKIIEERKKGVKGRGKFTKSRREAENVENITNTTRLRTNLITRSRNRNCDTVYTNVTPCIFHLPVCIPNYTEGT